MKEDYQPPREFRDLVDRLLGLGALSRVEKGRLEEYLDEPACRRYYVGIMMQEALLRELYGGRRKGGACEPFEHGAKDPWHFKSAKAAMLAAAAVVVFGLGAVAGALFTDRSRPSEQTATLQRWDDSGSASGGDQAERAHDFARVTGMIGVQWSDVVTGGARIADGSVAANRLVFETGLVELTYASGVRLTMEGPASFVVSGESSGFLDYGRLVSYVPPGGEGFTIGYSNGMVEDIGTEFAMDVGRDGVLELGVFDGEVRLHLPGDPPRPLVRDQALLHDGETSEGVRAIPFNRDKFVRRMPARDFRWHIDSDMPRELVFDVSHLVWRPGEYRAIFKWIDGIDAITVENVELRRNGGLVSSASGRGVSGFIHMAEHNMFRLDLDAESFEAGTWTLHALVGTYPRLESLEQVDDPVFSQGVMQFEEGLVSAATEADFVGRWSYYHSGHHYVRGFHADGTLTLERDGAPMPEAFVSCEWFVRDGGLFATQPQGGNDEHHVLRDRNTLIFVNRPYANAVRVEE